MKRTLLFLLSLQAATLTHANIIQFFWGNTYYNPAYLSEVNHYELLSGALAIETHAYFNGVGATSRKGEVASSTFQAQPYLRLAARIHPQWVIGVNISEPYYLLLKYPQGNVTEIDSTGAVTLNYDISPQVSYQWGEHWSFGAGLNFNRYQDFQSNFVSSTGIGNVVNDAWAWSYGWNVGLSYLFCDDTKVSLAYFSSLHPKLSGRSTGGMLANHHFKVRGITLPATTVLGFSHRFMPPLLTKVDLYYSQWSTNRVIRFINTAPAPLFAFPVHYRNSAALKLSGDYQFNPEYAVVGNVLFSSSAISRHGRTLDFSLESPTFILLGLRRQFNPEMSLQLNGTYGYDNTTLDHPFRQLDTHGHIQNRYFIGEIQLNYQC